MIKRLAWIALPFLLGCHQKTPEDKLRGFVENPANKITQAITTGDVSIVAKFLPASYRSITDGQDSTGKENERFYYFNVKFNKKDLNKPSKNQLLYLDFDMQNDFVLLVNNKDSVAPAICQKIENGMAGSYEYLVVFENNTSNKWNEFTLFYNDKIFNIGMVAFVYKEKDIKKIPVLKGKN